MRKPRLAQRELQGQEMNKNVSLRLLLYEYTYLAVATAQQQKSGPRDCPPLSLITPDSSRGRRDATRGPTSNFNERTYHMTHDEEDERHTKNKRYSGALRVLYYYCRSVFTYSSSNTVILDRRKRWRAPGTLGYVL